MTDDLAQQLNEEEEGEEEEEEEEATELLFGNPECIVDTRKAMSDVGLGEKAKTTHLLFRQFLRENSMPNATRFVLFFATRRWLI
jgi:hypothetical protein